MKISVLLPYKENFSPQYPGAVSLFVNETSKISTYKKNIIVFGSTNFKKKFNLKYINIKSNKNPFESQTKLYVNEFIKLQNSFNFSIIKNLVLLKKIKLLILAQKNLTHIILHTFQLLIIFCT